MQMHVLFRNRKQVRVCVSVLQFTQWKQIAKHKVI